MNLPLTSKEVHQLAVKKGWWDKEKDIIECLVMTTSEIFELLDAYRNNNKKHMVDEYADIVIRLLDTIGGQEAGKIKQWGNSDDFDDKNIIHIIGGFIYGIAGLLEAYGEIENSKAQENLLNKFTQSVHDLGKKFFGTHKMNKAIKDKHEYNKGREYRHGGKVC